MRAIDPEQRDRHEGYLAEILGSLGMDLHTPGTAETPRRFLQALIDATDGYGGDSKLVTVFPTECHADASCELAQIVEGPIPFFALSSTMRCRSLGRPTSTTTARAWLEGPEA